jgi:putative membrane protein
MASGTWAPGNGRCWRETLSERARATDYLANERTYLAWIRTGLATIGLGFVVAKFGVVVSTLAGVSVSPSQTTHVSDAIGIALVVVGGLMQVVALEGFKKNQKRIESGQFRPNSAFAEFVGVMLFVTAVLLAVYLLLTL